MLFAILEMTRTRMDWKKTEKRMKEAGFTDEEMKRFKEKPIEVAIRFLDEGRTIPVTLRGPHTSSEMEIKTEPYKPLFPIYVKKKAKNKWH